MKRLARFLEILFLLMMLGLCGVVISAGTGRVPYIFGYRILKVVSGSMQPAISDRTCILIRRAEQGEIRVGDIITFVSDDPAIQGFLNTHRVYEIETDAVSGEIRYITKGDAMAEPDIWPVAYEDIQGIYVREMPFGREIFKIIAFLSNRTNYFVVVILPLLLCCLSYMKDLVFALLGKEEDEDEP